MKIIFSGMCLQRNFSCRHLTTAITSLVVSRQVEGTEEFLLVTRVNNDEKAGAGTAGCMLFAVLLFALRVNNSRNNFCGSLILFK
jgi:hypothetical protein